VETHKSGGRTACRGSGLTFEVVRLPLPLSVLIDSWREEMDALQLLANESIFCERDRKKEMISNITDKTETISVARHLS